MFLLALIRTHLSEAAILKMLVWLWIIALAVHGNFDYIIVYHLIFLNNLKAQCSIVYESVLTTKGPAPVHTVMCRVAIANSSSITSFCS